MGAPTYTTPRPFAAPLVALRRARRTNRPLTLVGWLLAASGATWLAARHRVALVWTAGLAYLGFVLLLTWQALQAQTVIAPDALARPSLRSDRGRGDRQSQVGSNNAPTC